MRVLVVNNYGSFTCNVLVRRKDEISPEELLKLQPHRIAVSPGPRTPNEAGLSMEVVEKVPEGGRGLLGDLPEF